MAVDFGAKCIFFAIMTTSCKNKFAWAPMDFRFGCVMTAEAEEPEQEENRKSKESDAHGE